MKLRLPNIAAGALALFAIAATCPHQGKTNDRGGDQDCITCTADGENPATDPDPPHCTSSHTDTINAWCQCSANSKCESNDSVDGVNATWTTSTGDCAAGSCIRMGTPETHNAKLSEKDNSGCGS